MPSLTLVVPCKAGDEHHVSRLRRSLARQTVQDVEVLVITEGTSEEAKALGVHRATAPVIGFCCADNEFVHPDTLRRLVTALAQPGVVGAYTSHYHYDPTAPSLERYFALLGANDPLCWWLGKADRYSYFQGGSQKRESTFRTFEHLDQFPSIGDNGCIFRADLLQANTPADPAQFGSCMCVAVDLARAGHATYAITQDAIAHHTATRFWPFIEKRLRYIRTLYFQRVRVRRWHQVSGWRDWALAAAFGLSSLLVLPQLCVSVYGLVASRKVDWAWLWHPVVCGVLALGYGALWVEHVGGRMLRLSFARLGGSR